VRIKKKIDSYSAVIGNENYVPVVSTVSTSLELYLRLAIYKIPRFLSSPIDKIFLQRILKYLISHCQLYDSDRIYYYIVTFIIIF